jgi:thiol-disulfide isomerase/thioredoxin
MKSILYIALLLSSLAGASPFSTDIEKTFRDAKKEKKPILIDFFGIWCPPCNELDETVFETTRFLEKAKSFKLLKVDADSKSSWKIKDKYKVGGYPTILFTDSNGSEIYRITGYRVLSEFLRVMDLVLGAKGKSLEASCKSSDEQDLWRCAVVCSEQKDKACLDKTLVKLKEVLAPGSVRYQLARSLAVENSGTDDLKRDGLESLISEFPASPAALYWAVEYMQLFGSESKQSPKKNIVEKALANYSKMLSDPTQEELGISKTDMAQSRADLLEKLGKLDEAKAAWKEAADLLEKLSAELPKGTYARGFTLQRISCLENSGNIEEALSLAREYQKKFPKEFTFHYVVAGLLERQKKFNDAIPLAKKAFDHSYGDNRIRVATLLMRLYATVPDRESATKVYDAVTKDIKPDQKLEVRTHRYLLKLQEAFLKVPVKS